jgi:hypothetical protein
LTLDTPEKGKWAILTRNTMTTALGKSTDAKLVQDTQASDTPYFNRTLQGFKQSKNSRNEHLRTDSDDVYMTHSPMLRSE